MGGGMGKTQIALEFGHRVKNKKEAYSVIWLPAVTLAGFEQACARLVQELPIRRGDHKDAKEVMWEYFSSKTADQWLLIIDNADDREILFGSSGKSDGICRHLPQSSTGHILFTTRSRKIAFEIPCADFVDLQGMGQGEAVELLQSLLRHKDQLRDREMVRELLKHLTSLLLAVAQAANYMNNNDIP